MYSTVWFLSDFYQSSSSEHTSLFSDKNQANYFLEFQKLRLFLTRNKLKVYVLKFERHKHFESGKQLMLAAERLLPAAYKTNDRNPSG